MTKKPLSSTKNKGTKEILIFNPLTISDIENFIDIIKNEDGILCLDSTPLKFHQRIIDIVTGAVYCLDYKICKLDKFNYLIKR